jgi:hypothetical protein
LPSVDDEIQFLTETIIHGVSRDPSINAWLADITVDNSICHPPYEIWLREFAVTERLKRADTNAGSCLESLLRLAECFYKYGLKSFNASRSEFRTIDDVFGKVTELAGQHPAIRNWNEYADVIRDLTEVAKKTSYLSPWNWQSILAELLPSH